MPKVGGICSLVHDKVGPSITTNEKWHPNLGIKLDMSLGIPIISQLAIYPKVEINYLLEHGSHKQIKTTWNGI